jgi:class 3 adenylate cyclase
MNYSDAMISPTRVRAERRLAAILVADVAGYSRLMHKDEEATHARLSTVLADTVMPAIARHARTTAQAGLALQPDFTLRGYRENALSDSPAYLAGRERSCKGMRMAGVPEG